MRLLSLKQALALWPQFHNGVAAGLRLRPADEAERAPSASAERGPGADVLGGSRGIFNNTTSQAGGVLFCSGFKSHALLRQTHALFSSSSRDTRYTSLSLSLSLQRDPSLRRSTGARVTRTWIVYNRPASPSVQPQYID